MGLLDDLMGPIRDIASVKDEVVKEVTGIGDTFKETAESLKQPLDTPPSEGQDEEKQA